MKLKGFDLNDLRSLAAVHHFSVFSHPSRASGPGKAVHGFSFDRARDKLSPANVAVYQTIHELPSHCMVLQGRQRRKRPYGMEGEKTVVDELKLVQISKRSNSATQGDKSVKVSLDLAIYGGVVQDGVEPI